MLCGQLTHVAFSPGLPFCMCLEFFRTIGTVPLICDELYTSSNSLQSSSLVLQCCYKTVWRLEQNMKMIVFLLWITATLSVSRFVSYTREAFLLLSQKNLSPGNCVAATVFPQEIMLLTINIATVYPKEILSSGKTVARHGSVQIYDVLAMLLAFCCNQTYISSSL